MPNQIRSLSAAEIDSVSGGFLLLAALFGCTSGGTSTGDGGHTGTAPEPTGGSGTATTETGGSGSAGTQSGGGSGGSGGAGGSGG
jgi:hypothetical protein